MVMKNLTFIKSVVLAVLGTLTVYGSEIIEEKTSVAEKDIVQEDTFNELLLTGQTSSGELTLNQNKAFYLKLPKQDKAIDFKSGKVVPFQSNDHYYELIEIKNGFLLINCNLVKSSGEMTNHYSEHILQKLLLNGISKLRSANLDIFPKYPILLGNSEELLSGNPLPLSAFIRTLQHLFYNMKTSIEYSFLGDDENMGKAMAILSDYCWKSCMNVTKYFEAAYKSGIFSAGKTMQDYQNFNQAKEDFFSLLHSVNSKMYQPISKTEFLEQVFKIDAELNNIFSRDKPVFSISRDSNIYKGLTNKLSFVRDTYAKAILLSVFFHPDVLSHPEVNEKSLVLTLNYGQVARWIKHINTDDEYSHIFTSNEYKKIDPSTLQKSFWVLKEGRSYVDLYKTLLVKIAAGQFWINVHDVTINQRAVRGNMVENIVIDVEYRQELKDLDDIVEAMKTFDNKWNPVEANGIRFVVRESGYLDLITAFPIRLDSISPEAKKTGSVLERLKDFVNLKDFPQAKQYVVMLPDANMGITKSIKK